MSVAANELEAIEARAIGAWNEQDVEAVVACYTSDLIYVDPNTNGAVRGADAMRRYLTKLFERWQMHWTVKEVLPLANGDGAAARWTATITSRKTGGTVEIEGVDLVFVDGDRIRRNEVYFDRAPLA